MSALRCYCIFNFIPQAGWITFRGALQYVVHFLAAVSPRQVLIELDGPVTAPIPHLYPQSPFIYATLYIHHTFIHAVYIIHFYLYIIHSSCQFHHSPKIRLFTWNMHLGIGEVRDQLLTDTIAECQKNLDLINFESSFSYTLTVNNLGESWGLNWTLLILWNMVSKDAKLMKTSVLSAKGQHGIALPVLLAHLSQQTRAGRSGGPAPNLPSTTYIPYVTNPTLCPQAQAC